ncbi:MAG: hypothetical protein M3081_01370 [Gemmatimonadota bacterium]|nr:hypothetical protein [Gemmatimonadota bacterium]
MRLSSQANLAAFIAAVLLPFAVAASAGAQGSVSTQGFGYPAGGLSARNAGTGGALGEFDPLSPLNDAALASWGATGLYFQFQPEYRTTNSIGGQDKTTTVRFPLLAAGLPLGERWVFGVSTTTFLDRTWRTQRTALANIGGDTATFTETFGVAGAINDIRVGAAFLVNPNFRIGLAGHALSGRNRLQINRRYADPVSFAPFFQASEIDYSGNSISGGIDVRPTRQFALALSARVGGTIKSFSGDTVLTRADVPKHYAGSILYTGLPGTNIGIRAAWDGWSSLHSLAATNVNAVDGWDIGVGGETRGVTLFGSALPLRLGVRMRTLPFAVGTQEVKETSIGGGFGLPFGTGRVSADISVQHASRTGTPGVSEHAWVLGIGFLVRP